MASYFERLIPYQLKWSELNVLTFTLEPWGEDARRRFRMPPPEPDDPGIRPGVHKAEPHLLLSGKEIWQRSRNGTARWDDAQLELDPGTPESMLFHAAGNESAIAILRTISAVLVDDSTTEEGDACRESPLGAFYYLHQESRFSELTATHTENYQFFRAPSDGEGWAPRLYEFSVSRGPGSSEESHLEDFFEKWKAFDIARPQLAYRNFFKTPDGEVWATKFALAWAGRCDIEDNELSTDAEPRSAELPPTSSADTQFVMAATHRVEDVLRGLSDQVTELRRVQTALLHRVGVLVLLVLGLLVLLALPVAIGALMLSR